MSALATSLNQNLENRLLAGRFRMQTLIARGGVGAVYRAVDRKTNDPVAVKVLELDHDSPLARRQFFNEAILPGLIAHDAALKIVDSGVEDAGICYIAMELLQGPSLSMVLDGNGALPREQAISIASNLCAVLQEAHQAGFLHLDVKPENVMLVREQGVQRAKLVDFGQAIRLSRALPAEEGADLVGSPHYLAPERILGQAPTVQSDVYSIGVLLFRMLTGREAFRGSLKEILAKHVSHPPPLLADAFFPEPEALQYILNRCLAKSPSERFSSMAEVASHLEFVNQGMDFTVEGLADITTDTQTPAFMAPLRRSGAAVWLASSLVGFAAVLGGFGVWFLLG